MEIYWGYMRIMEKKMETTIVIGYIEIMGFKVAVCLGQQVPPVKLLSQG